MKVYCKNCEHFRIYYGDSGLLTDSCVAPELGITKNYIYGDRKTKKYVGDEDYPNKRDVGECKFYKEKVKKVGWLRKLIIK